VNGLKLAQHSLVGFVLHELIDLLVSVEIQKLNSDVLVLLMQKLEVLQYVAKLKIFYHTRHAHSAPFYHNSPRSFRTRPLVANCSPPHDRPRVRDWKGAGAGRRPPAAGKAHAPLFDHRIVAVGELTGYKVVNIGDAGGALYLRITYLFLRDPEGNIRPHAAVGKKYLLRDVGTTALEAQKLVL